MASLNNALLQTLLYYVICTRFYGMDQAGLHREWTP